MDHLLQYVFYNETLDNIVLKCALLQLIYIFSILQINIINERHSLLFYEPDMYPNWKLIVKFEVSEFR